MGPDPRAHRHALDTFYFRGPGPRPGSDRRGPDRTARRRHRAQMRAGVRARTPSFRDTIQHVRCRRVRLRFLYRVAAGLRCRHNRFQ